MEENMKNEIIMYESSDGAVKLPIRVDYGGETVWATQGQISDLFERDISVISRHINNIFKEELDKESNLHFLQIANSDKPVAFYSLDVIISVGYRVKSKRGIEFRKWANSVLKDYIIKGYAVNNNRIKELGEVIRIMKRTENSLDDKQVLSVIEKYSTALDMLDDYDHQTMKRPEGSKSVYVLTYEECRRIIDEMKFSAQSPLFGNEKDESFKGSIGNIYQSFGGKDLYPSIEEKAANLLYLVTKNHSFSDGNKRIAATVFLYFLDKNGALFKDGEKLIDDHTLVALTILIAESKPEEKEMMITVIMNCICGKHCE
ncbi:MAG: virulence protein RhuM/Fic/DOC family protein [Clostridiales bacterium]|nr:virulence protein RhuM/Fic/DOC family protein [Clostridiales bacterium]